MLIAPTIRTRGGHTFDFTDPSSNVIDIHDIAHALSQLCRFTGHTREFYSVAQHCVMVSLIVPPELALAGLLHDAAEAYLGDVSSPLKQMLPDYKAIEESVETAVLASVGISLPLDPRVKVADLIMLATEKRDLFCEKIRQEKWAVLAGVGPLIQPIRAWSAPKARIMFLNRYWELTDDPVAGGKRAVA